MSSGPVLRGALVGGRRDLLRGGNGRDVLIGGAGSDTWTARENRTSDWRRTDHDNHLAAWNRCWPIETERIDRHTLQSPARRRAGSTVRI